MDKTTQKLPSGFGQLKLSMLMNWRNERKAHLHQDYMPQCKALIAQQSRNKLATCYFCGFPDGQFLELHHLDGDHSNYNSKNLVLACSCCHRLHHLGWVAIENLGKLTFMPQNVIKKVKTSSLQPQNMGLLELLNLFQFYKLAQGIRRDSERQDKLGDQPLGGLFSETRVLMGSSGLANNYANQLAYEYKKRLILQKRQQLTASEEEQASQNGDASQQKTQDVQKAAQDAMNQHSELESEQAKQEIEALEKDLEQIEKRIHDAQSLDQLEDVNKAMKAALFADFQSYAAGSLHLLDILETLESLDQVHIKKKSGDQNTQMQSDGVLKDSPTKLFFDSHNEALKNGQGVFTVEFNPSILEPWHPDSGYSLQDRLNYYVKILGLGAAKGYLIYPKGQDSPVSIPGLDGIVARFDQLRERGHEP